MPYGAHGVNLTVVQTLADYVAKGPRFPLGHEVVLPARTGGGLRSDMGEQVWIYVYNDEAAADFVQGTIVARDAATTPFHGILSPLSCSAARVLGVAQHTIPFGGAGFILKKGIGEVLADTGGITLDTGLVPGNAVTGRADNAAAVTNQTFAISTETVLATALATCYINCVD